MPQQVVAPPADVKNKGIKPTNTERQQLTEMCKSFLQVQIPSSNIISAGKFARFANLFNKEAVEKMTESEQKRLYAEYHREFSLQHPIKVYGGVVADPEEAGKPVIYVQADREYHEVLYTIPPMFRPLKTLNELGSQTAADLINSFLNTAIKSENPIAQAEFEKYGFVIGKLLTDLNPPDAEAEKQFENAEHNLVGDGEGDDAKKSQSESDAMTDMFDDW